MFNRFVFAIALALTAGPAMAELTDYQQGVLDGIEAALSVGKLQGMAEYDSATVADFNQAVDPWNAWLAQVFGNDQAVLDNYSLQKMDDSWVNQTATLEASGNQIAADQNATGQPAPEQNTVDQTSSKPIIHEIDGTVQKISPEPLIPDYAQEEMIHGYPKSAYCTMYPDSAPCNN